MKILLLLFIIFFSIAGVHAETAQYYNETSGQMEVPIYMIGGVTTENYVSYCSLENGNLSVFADIAGNGDKVKRYNAVTGSFVSATYFNGVWSRLKQGLDICMNGHLRTEILHGNTTRNFTVPRMEVRSLRRSTFLQIMKTLHYYSIFL